MNNFSVLLLAALAMFYTPALHSGQVQTLPQATLSEMEITGADTTLRFNRNAAAIIAASSKAGRGSVAVVISASSCGFVAGF